MSNTKCRSSFVSCGFFAPGDKKAGAKIPDTMNIQLHDAMNVIKSDLCVTLATSIYCQILFGFLCQSNAPLNVDVDVA